jgi:hypothetical protein
LLHLLPLSLLRLPLQLRLRAPNSAQFLAMRRRARRPMFRNVRNNNRNISSSPSTSNSRSIGSRNTRRSRGISNSRSTRGRRTSRRRNRCPRR